MTIFLQHDGLRDRMGPIIAGNGLFLIILSFSQFILFFIDLLLEWGVAHVFLTSGLISGIVGYVAWSSHDRNQTEFMSSRQLFLSMVTSWITVSVFGAIPLYLAEPYLSPLYAIFESTSAITTTGATVVTGIDSLPKTILFWRSLLSWYGGMGVIVAGMLLFPAMRIGGMQLFIRPGFEQMDKIMPTARGTAMVVFRAYTILTFACTISYVIAGLSFFDALNLAMSTMATCGLAVSDASFANYNGAVHYVAAIFMLLAGMPLVAHIYLQSGRVKSFVKEPQIPYFLGIALLVTILISSYRLFVGQAGVEESFRESLFISVSLLTGTGFTNGDHELWGAFPTFLLFLVMFVGGCTGSTSGAIKIFRFQVLFAVMRVAIKRLHYPHAIAVPKYDHRTLDASVIESVAAFFMIYMGTLVILSILFALAGLDLLTAFSAAVSAVGNVGPGLGAEIGAVGNYAGFNNFELIIYNIAMLVGRLEFIFFYVLILPNFWRH